MSEHEELPLVSKSKAGRPSGSRNVSGAQIRADIASTDMSLGNLSREQIAHGEGRAPRRAMNGLDLNLYFDPKYTANKNVYYRIFVDDNRGRIQKALAAYYDFVRDENGVKLSRQSGIKTMYLMGLDMKYRKMDDKLKFEKTQATMKAKRNESVGVEGLEDVDESKSSESSDKFSANY